MLTSRGQENLLHARPTNGKALLPKTPSNFQTPRTTNRAPLGAKTTNAKAQTIFRDQENAKLQVFKTPAPGQQRIKPEKSANQKSANRPSTARRSGKSKLNVAPTEPTKVEALTREVEDDEPEFGYAPPAPIELPDPPMDFGYDETFPQFRPENMFRGYGEIYLSSPKDENGMSIRLKKEEEEYRKYMEQEEREYTEKVRLQMAKPLFVPDDEDDFPATKIQESKPDTLKAKSAATALSGFKLPSVTTKQTTSSRLKMSKPIAKSSKPVDITKPKPLSVSKNTIGFPKARRPPSIIPQIDESDVDSLADELADFEFAPIDFGDEDGIFQL